MHFSLCNTYSLPGLVCAHISVQPAGDKSALRKSFKGLQSDKQQTHHKQPSRSSSPAQLQTRQWLGTSLHNSTLLSKTNVSYFTVKIMLLTDSSITNIDG